MNPNPRHDPAANVPLTEYSLKPLPVAHTIVIDSQGRRWKPREDVAVPGVELLPPMRPPDVSTRPALRAHMEAHAWCKMEAARALRISATKLDRMLRRFKLREMYDARRDTGAVLGRSRRTRSDGPALRLHQRPARAGWRKARYKPGAP